MQTITWQVPKFHENKKHPQSPAFVTLSFHSIPLHGLVENNLWKKQLLDTTNVWLLK